MDATEKLLELKRAKFSEAVEIASISRKWPLPRVNFDGSLCPLWMPNHLAHRHSGDNLICISKDSLSMMTNEQIKITADHEVSHLADSGHGTNFQRENTTTSIASFRPPEGTVTIYEGQSRDLEKYCNYPDCEQEKELEKCPRCGVRFCKKHLAPPHLEETEKAGDEAEDRGHVCPALTETEQVENLRRSGLIDIHWFITKMFNVHLNAFIAEYAIRTASGSAGRAGGFREVKVKDHLLSQLADVLEYEREKILRQKRLVAEEDFRDLIDYFLFSVYESGLKVKYDRPEVRGKLLTPLSLLFKSIDEYWKGTYCINKIKEIESKITHTKLESPKPQLFEPESIEPTGEAPFGGIGPPPPKIKTLIMLSFILLATVIFMKSDLAPSGLCGTLPWLCNPMSSPPSLSQPTLSSPPNPTPALTATPSPTPITSVATQMKGLPPVPPGYSKLENITQTGYESQQLPREFYGKYVEGVKARYDAPDPFSPYKHVYVFSFKDSKVANDFLKAIIEKWGRFENSPTEKSIATSTGTLVVYIRSTGDVYRGTVFMVGTKIYYIETKSEDTSRKFIKEDMSFLLSK